MSDLFEQNNHTSSVVILKDVSVCYRVPSEAVGTFKEYLIRLVQGRIKHNDFFALQDINLKINKGEIFGILGRNGAGKSTLLKVISKVLIPASGRVWTQGQVSPLLQLGAGFHPELTGRENIYLNATLLGHTRAEIDDKINEIIGFAEIGEFIETPLRTYSSGMQARLGFAVATAWQPDILILDEVLSVGDFAFQQKCFERMSAFRDSGATVLMVSHDIERVQSLCERAMWMDHGKIINLGNVTEICKKYKKALTK
jgi:ABC-2 type transport system ATP-binding protein/lipopolysaccharide transport system ATP-binding protein